MPKAKVDVWELPENPKILELLLFEYPNPVKRKEITEYLEDTLDDIYDKKVSRRLERLREEELIEKAGHGLYRISKKQYPPTLYNLLLKAIKMFKRKEIIPDVGSVSLIFGISPELLNDECSQRLKDIDSKIRDCVFEIGAIKQLQINNFINREIHRELERRDGAIGHLLSNHGEAIRKLTCQKYFDEQEPSSSRPRSYMLDYALLTNSQLEKQIEKLKADFLAMLTVVDNMVVKYLYNDSPKDKEIMRKKSEKLLEKQARKRKEIVAKDIEINFLSAISTLEKKQREGIVEIISNLAALLSEYVPTLRHGVAAIRPDSYDYKDSQIPVSASSYHQTSRQFNIIDSFIKSANPQEYISSQLQQMHRRLKSINNPEELKAFQFLARTLECPKCYHPISPKNIISTGHPDDKIKYLTDNVYVYNCDCRWKGEKTFREIDIEELEKEMEIKKKQA